MKNFISELNTKKDEVHPVELAARAHFQLVNIHPFIDGNGRCARLLSNLILLKAGYAVIIIPPVVRADYVEALKQAQTKHNTKAFIDFISEMVLESMKDYLRIVKHLAN